MSETSILIDSLQHLEISRQSSLRTNKKSAFTVLTLCLFFHINMPIIHTFMASTFQCENCQCFTFKICNKSHTKIFIPWRYVW